MHTLIIAEAGVNHNGDMLLAKRLVDAAAKAGADYVKFQMFKADKLVSKSAKKADYQIANMNDDDNSQHAMLKSLELSLTQHIELKTYCSEVGIGFLSTGFDTTTMRDLVELGIDLIKVPSGEVTNLPYLRDAASYGLPVVLSTGMCSLQEVRDAANALYASGLPKDKLTILHCNTEYPTPMQDVNLRAMQTIAYELEVPIGYSDHTLGIEVPIAAVAMGAVCIEKHFTLNRSMDGPDHAASLEPDELIAMVSAIRNIEKALGNGVKEPSDSERKNIKIARKSLFASRSLEIGDRLTANDLVALRPGEGISPMNIDNIIGKVVTKKINELDQIDPNDFR